MRSPVISFTESAGRKRVSEVQGVLVLNEFTGGLATDACGRGCMTCQRLLLPLYFTCGLFFLVSVVVYAICKEECSRADTYSRGLTTIVMYA